MKKIILGVLVVMMTCAAMDLQAQFRGGSVRYSIRESPRPFRNYSYIYGGYNYFRNDVGINFNYGGYWWSVPCENLYSGYVYTIPRGYYNNIYYKDRTVRFVMRNVLVTTTYTKFYAGTNEPVLDANGYPVTYSVTKESQEWVIE